MISLKRYLDTDGGTSGVGLLAAMLSAYQSALTAMGTSAIQACPSAGPTLQRQLVALSNRLADGEATDPELIGRTEALVVKELQQFGDLAEDDLRQKAEDVKSLLLILTQTASAIASTDQGCAKRFSELRTRLERIATLEDVTELRGSLLRSAAELNSYVEDMSQHAQESVARLQAKVATYQARLEEAEHVASHDALTGLWNRSAIEAHIENRIAFGRTFSVALLDLDGFKAVNDRFGHTTGDDILKQFTDDLKSNSRPTDHLGRWGGDEFVIVLDCPTTEAHAHIDRIEKWVLGDYPVETTGGRQKVRLNASIGIAEWRPGKSARDVITQADTAMYAKKSAKP